MTEQSTQGSSVNFSDWALAVHPETPEDVLDRLAEHPCERLLERLAEHPAASENLLTKLSLHECATVRAAVAENKRTPVCMLLKLAADECPDVRYVIAENALSPMMVLQLLAEDDNPYVAHRARNTMQRISAAPAQIATLPPPQEHTQSYREFA